MPQPIRKSNLIAEDNPSSPITEMYRTLRTAIAFTAAAGPMQVLVMASAQPGEGKSTTVSNLAAVYAQEQGNKRILAIDGDLRRPTLHHHLAISNRSGLTSVLSGMQTLEQSIKPTRITNLDLLPSGPLPPNPADLLGSPRMAELLASLRQQYALILIDSPPVLAAADAQLLAALADGVILVVHSGKLKREAAAKAVAKLEQVKARMLGVVLNNRKPQDVEAYQYRYYSEQAAE